MLSPDAQSYPEIPEKYSWKSKSVWHRKEMYRTIIWPTLVDGETDRLARSSSQILTTARYSAFFSPDCDVHFRDNISIIHYDL